MIVGPTFDRLPRADEPSIRLAPYAGFNLAPPAPTVPLRPAASGWPGAVIETAVRPNEPTSLAGLIPMSS